jgi:hypothetical protein
MRRAGHAARTEHKKNNAYKILVGKPKGKKPIGRHRFRWGIILKWILDGEDGMSWTDLAKDRDQLTAHVNTVINFRVP